MGNAEEAKSSARWYIYLFFGEEARVLGHCASVHPLSSLSLAFWPIPRSRLLNRDGPSFFLLKIPDCIKNGKLAQNGIGEMSSLMHGKHGETAGGPRSSHIPTGPAIIRKVVHLEHRTVTNTILEGIEEVG